MKWMARATLGVLLPALLATSALAADVKVMPGKDALARAIQSARPGDRLMLAAGNYVGGLQITKPLEIHGDGHVHVKGREQGSVIRIDAPDVVIKGLKLTGSGSDHQTIDSGVQLTKKATNAIVRDNNIKGNLYGVDIHGARNALVEGNTITGRQDRLMNRRGNGVYVWNAPGAQVRKSVVENFYGQN